MKVFHGIPASPGLAIGPARVIRPVASSAAVGAPHGTQEEEVARLEAAMRGAARPLVALRERLSGEAADIVDIQLAMLDDPELREGSIARVQQGESAQAAVSAVGGEYADMLSTLPDPYLAARADDVREAVRRIIAALRGEDVGVQLDGPAVLVAHDLTPAELLDVAVTQLLGIVAETGSATGHLAIVSQGLGIPAVLGVPDVVHATENGAVMIVDGGAGTVTVNPDEESLAATRDRLTREEALSAELDSLRDRPGATADGVRIEVFANIGSVQEARGAVANGAEGVGLLRTELLLTAGVPDEDHQAAVYEEIATVLQAPMVVRTFDIGADKPAPGLELPAEQNPFLGWRGIRLALDRPAELFLPQVRAVLRVAARHDVRLMLPMVTHPEEVREARELIRAAHTDLVACGVACREVPVGIMVETPAAALTVDRFAGLADFVSIGTNDLTQYVYAVDRTNARVSGRAHPLGIALLRLIDTICRSGLPTAVCGQLAADPEAVPILVGLGVRELSVAPARVPHVKSVLARMTLAEMQERAREALSAT